uniref:Uncharacterized protein n=1 Tax=Wuchereria bancrofti TaxID=6293 RepID=A0A1I8EVN0_WUCBA
MKSMMLHTVFFSMILTNILMVILILWMHRKFVRHYQQNIQITVENMVN